MGKKSDVLLFVPLVGPPVDVRSVDARFDVVRIDILRDPERQGRDHPGGGCRPPG